MTTTGIPREGAIVIVRSTLHEPSRNPFEFVKVVREEPKDSIDRYTEEEGDRILEGFRKKRPH